MEEQLVSFNTAKLAKEKGFDFHTVYSYYDIDDGYTLGYALCYSEVYEQTDSCLLAPTQSLLQKWLRDKHKLHIEIYCGKDKTSLWFTPEVHTLKKPKDGNGDDEYSNLYKNKIEACDFDTYEEALEYGLYKALKLIKK